MTDAVPAERAGLAVAVFGVLTAHGFETGMRLSLAVSAGLLLLTGAVSFRLSGRPARRA